MNWHIWYSHPWRILRSSYRKLAWVRHEPKTTESRSLICIKNFWNQFKDWVTSYHWNILIIVSVPASSPKRSFPLFLALLSLACYCSTCVVLQFIFPDLLLFFCILPPRIHCSAFYHSGFSAPCFTVPDLLFRIPCSSVLCFTASPFCLSVILFTCKAGAPYGFCLIRRASWSQF